MTDAAGECRGLGPIDGLNRIDVTVADGVRIPTLFAACEASRVEARARLPWLEVGLHAVDHPLVHELDGREILRSSSSVGDDELLTFLPTEGGDEVLQQAAHHTGGPSLYESLTAINEGGLWLTAATRYSDALADLVDDIANCLGGNARGHLAVGRIPTGCEALEDCSLAIIIPLDGSVLVTTSESSTATEVSTGSIGVWTDVVSLSTVGQAPVAICTVRQPTRHDLWEFVIRTAGFWPKLRADMPFGLFSPAASYGSDDLVLPIEVLIESSHALQSPETLRNSIARFRSEVVPSPRPAPPEKLYPNSIEEWAQATIRGRFPGGLSYLELHSESEYRLAFAGCSVRMDGHVVDGIVQSLAFGEPFRVSEVKSDCPHGDPYCVARSAELLYSLRVVDLVETVM